MNAFCPIGAAKPTPCPQPHATTLSESSTSKASCVCAPTYYAAAGSPLLNCTPCPVRASCIQPNTTLLTLAVDAGAWRPGYASTDVKLCPHEDACAGGATTDNAFYLSSREAGCAPGRGLTGAYCLLCAEPTTHFFDAITTRCKACRGSQLYAVAFVVVAAAISGAAWAAWWMLGVTRDLFTALAKRMSFRAKLRVAISFFQIVTQLDAVYSLRYPAPYVALLRRLSLVNLHLFGWLPGLHPVCFGLPSLEAQLWFATLVPLVIAVAAFPAAKIIFRQPPAAALPFVLGWTFLLFPAISSRGFRALAPCDCFKYNDGKETCFLREDFQVECIGSLFGRPSAPPSVLAPAWAAVAVWAVGVPLMYAALLLKRASLPVSLGLLLGDYRPEMVGWDLVVVSEKLVIVGFLSLFAPGSWTQLFIAVIVALSTFVLQARLTPFRKKGDNFFAFLSGAMLVFVLLGSLGLQVEALAPLLHADPTLEVCVLFIATLLVLFVALAFFVVELRAARAHLREAHQKNWRNGVRVEMILKVEDAPVHIISTPHFSPAGVAKADEVKEQYEEPPRAHCYNPNTDCDQAGEDGWLQVWFNVCSVTKRTGGKVILVYNADGNGKYGDGWFDGQAQVGELFYAQNVLGCTNIEWVGYNSPQLQPLHPHQTHRRTHLPACVRFFRPSAEVHVQLGSPMSCAHNHGEDSSAVCSPLAHTMQPLTGSERQRSWGESSEQSSSHPLCVSGGAQCQ